MFRLDIQSGSGATDFFKDLLPRLVPHIPARRLIMRGKEIDDGLGQCGEAWKAFGSQMHRDVPEEPLHEVHPGASRGGEVNVEAWMPRQPFPHRRMLVGGVVVHHKMQGHAPRDLPVDLPEELEPLDVGVLGVKARDHFAVKCEFCKRL